MSDMITSLDQLIDMRKANGNILNTKVSATEREIAMSKNVELKNLESYAKDQKKKNLQQLTEAYNTASDELVAINQEIAELSVLQMDIAQKTQAATRRMEISTLKISVVGSMMQNAAIQTVLQPELKPEFKKEAKQEVNETKETKLKIPDQQYVDALVECEGKAEAKRILKERGYDVRRCDI
jgi:hypothetical protein